MSIFSWFTDLFPWKSELSHSWTRQFRINGKNEITKKVLLDNPEARDDEELFLWLVDGKCTSRMDLVGFDRSWRYVQQHFPTLRGSTWEERQRKAELYRKNL